MLCIPDYVKVLLACGGKGKWHATTVHSIKHVAAETVDGTCTDSWTELQCLIGTFAATAPLGCQNSTHVPCAAHSSHIAIWPAMCFSQQGEQELASSEWLSKWLLCSRGRCGQKAPLQSNTFPGAAPAKTASEGQPRYHYTAAPLPGFSGTCQTIVQIWFEAH